MAELSSRYEVHANQIGQWRKTLLSGIPDIFSDKRRHREEDSEAEKARLYEQIGRLQMELDWLGKKMSSWDVKARRPLVEPGPDQLPVARQCELLLLPRSSYYYRPRGVSAADVACLTCLDTIFTAHPFYGTRRLKDELVVQGYPVGRKRVRRLMGVMGLETVYPKKRLSQPHEGHTVYPYLLRRLEISRPDQVWATDLTCLRLKGGFAYLMAVMDWYSRYVVAWELSMTMETRFCVSVLEEDLLRGQPDIFNTDQGSQFTASDCTDRLRAAGVRISMDGRGRVFDNIMVERLWRTIKYENVYLQDYPHLFAAREGLEAYMTFYNYERRHSSLGNKTPGEVYWAGSRAARETG